MPLSIAAGPIKRKLKIVSYLITQKTSSFRRQTNKTTFITIKLAI